MTFGLELAQERLSGHLESEIRADEKQLSFHSTTHAAHDYIRFLNYQPVKNFFL